MKISHLLLLAVGGLLFTTSCEKTEYVTDMGTYLKVEAGSFTMGSIDGDMSSEQPAHKVTLTKSFFMGTREVTQSQWESVMGSNPSEIVGAELPVNNVSLADVTTFIKKLNEKSGKTYRLPTEAEWEFAARGGNSSQSHQFAGSDNAQDVAWYADNSNDELNLGGLKAPNELGLYDMSGNVAEFCSDKCDPYELQDQVDPVGKRGAVYAIRGGSFDSPEQDVRTRARNSVDPRKSFYNLGFRLVLDGVE